MIDERALMQELSKYCDEAVDGMENAKAHDRRESVSYYSGYVDALNTVAVLITLEIGRSC